MTAIGALIGLSLSILLIIRKLSPTYSLIIGAIVGGLLGHPGGIADSDSRSLVRHINTNRSYHGHLQCDYKQNG